MIIIIDLEERMKLENLFNQVKELQTEVNMNIVAYTGVVWCYYSNGDLSINTQGQIDDLFNGDGATYNYDVRGCVESEDGYVMFYDADNCCGTRDTIILKASERGE
jgi:hypothetical protein